VAVLLLILNLSAHAQSAEGTILGHVTDPSGAVVPGADVVITNVDTNMKFTAKTSSVGDYLFVNVTPGKYNIEVAEAGFKGSHANNVQLDVQATLRQNFVLQLGDAQETVEVSADAQMIQADNATQGGVIESKAIDNLPISGRDFTNLLKLQAGATQVQGSSQLYWAQHGLNNDFASVSINGARTESVSYLVDGITDNDQFFSTANNIPNSESIAEFKTQSGLYSPEFGQGSAQVSVAVKNGGNQYHGSAYDYFRSDLFQPHNPLYAYQKEVKGEDVDTSKTPYKQHQYGFSLGGPITIPHLYNGANHSFFFYSYEVGSRRTSKQSTALIPSAQERTGDFSDWKDANGNLVALYDPTTQTGSDASTRQAFTNNKITSLSTIGKNFLAMFPTPNVAKSNMAACVAAGSSSCYNYVATVKSPYDTNNQTFRVDHRLDDKNLFYLTAVLGEQNYHNANILPETGSQTYQRNRLFAFNWQRVITPTVVNEARAGYNWQSWFNGADSTGVDWGTKLGFANEVTNPDFFALPTLELSGFTPIGNSNTGWHQKENIYQFVDNLKFVKGRHAFTVGLDIRRYLLSLNDASSSEGDLQFDGRYSTTTPQTAKNGKYGTSGAGSAVADMLLGDPSSLSAPTVYGSDMFNVRGTSWNFFAADDIHLTPKLTINLGIRYELPASYHSPDDSGITADLSTSTGQFQWASKSNYQLMKTIGATSTWQGYTSNNKLTDANHSNLAPRVGFAYRPLNTDKLVIRGGYGLFYDLQNLWYSLNTYDNIKSYLGSGSYSNDSTGETSVAPYPLDTLWQAVGTDYSYFMNPGWKTGPQINWPHNKSPYNQQWSFGGQYALTASTLIDINYVGSHGLHQPGYWYYNAAKMPNGLAILSDGTDCNAYRDDSEASSACLTNANYSATDTRTPWSNIRSKAYAVANIFSARYNALQVRFNQRMSHGLLYQVNYTWSRTMDEVSAINNIANSALTLQNAHCAACDWGPASSDQTQRVVGSGTWQLPVGKGRTYSIGKIGDYVAGGWDFTGIYTLASGQPLTVRNTDSGSLGEDGVRMDVRRPNTTGNPRSNTVASSSGYLSSSLKGSIYHAFNPTAYTAGAANTYGNTSRNSVRGPFYQRGDIALSKNFSLYKEHNLAYKFEMFNVLSPWRSSSEIDVKTALSNTSAGSLVDIDVDSASNPLAIQGGTRHLWNPRIIQMSLKYSF
jgi:hypothetical protein